MAVRLPARFRGDWTELTRPTEPVERFDPAMAAHLPEPARRWLVHAIAPGTPLLHRVVLEQHGAMRLGAWRHFQAIEALAPLEGFIWAATARVFSLPVSCLERYHAGTGELRQRALGLVNVAADGGPDLSRSVAGRQVCELLWVPAVALAPGTDWKPVDQDRATMLITCDGYVQEVTVTVDPSGELLSATIPRWSSAAGRPWHEELFALVCHGEATFAGYTIPVHVTAGWGYGTNRWSKGGVLVRQVVDQAVYR